MGGWHPTWERRGPALLPDLIMCPLLLRMSMQLQQIPVKVRRYRKRLFHVFPTQSFFLEQGQLSGCRESVAYLAAVHLVCC